MIAVVNVKIYDYDTYIDDGYCLFNEKIVEIGSMNNFRKNEEIGQVIDGRNKLLLPGLINFHTHVYSTLVRGASIPFNPTSFNELLEQLWWKFDSQLDNTATYNSGLIYGIESLKNGVTSLIDHHASGIDIKGSLTELKKAIVETLGMRGIFCFETSDRFDVEECIEENLTGLAFNSSDAKGMFGLHASMSLSNETLEEISKIIEKNPIHVHVAESKEDEDDSLSKYGKRVVERYNDYNLINEKSIFAHCVHIDEKEAEIMSKKGACIALNPTSNLNNAVGFFNYTLYKKFNIPILIGTDGLGTNIAKEWTNLFYLGKAGMKNPVGISLDEIKEYIVHSYEYFGQMMGIKIGKIKQDFVADLLLVDYIQPTTLDENNVFGHLFFGLFDNFKPSWVFVKGKPLIKEYKSIFDEDRIYQEAVEVSKKLWKRIEKIN
ncbi:MAG: amidohydrolase family protein [Candidatus Heimdallarchaeaceae archaeon]